MAQETDNEWYKKIPRGLFSIVNLVSYAEKF